MKRRKFFSERICIFAVRKITANMPFKLKKASIEKSLFGLLPILEWAPKYNTHKLMCDVIAGVTVGLTVMPQSLAYATLAGLEPQVCKIETKCGTFIKQF